MNSEKLNAWLQVIGLFAVVMSLMAVVFELRQAQTAMRAPAYQASHP